MKNIAFDKDPKHRPGPVKNGRRAKHITLHQSIIPFIFQDRVCQHGHQKEGGGGLGTKITRNSMRYAGHVIMPHAIFTFSRHGALWTSAWAKE